jgi:hypothetical protein
MTIYSDKQYEIHRLMNTTGYKLIAEVFKDDGRLVGALFTKERGNFVTQK